MITNTFRLVGFLVYCVIATLLNKGETKVHQNTIDKKPVHLGGVLFTQSGISYLWLSREDRHRICQG
jgi:hypothetical protein